MDKYKILLDVLANHPSMGGAFFVILLLGLFIKRNLSSGFLIVPFLVGLVGLVKEVTLFEYGQKGRFLEKIDLYVFAWEIICCSAFYYVLICIFDICCAINRKRQGNV